MRKSKDSSDGAAAFTSLLHDPHHGKVLKHSVLPRDTSTHTLGPPEMSGTTVALWLLSPLLPQRRGDEDKKTAADKQVGRGGQSTPTSKEQNSGAFKPQTVRHG